MIHSGTGTTTLVDINTYLGATTVASGTLSFRQANMIAKTSQVELSGSTLQINGYSQDFSTPATRRR